MPPALMEMTNGRALDGASGTAAVVQLARTVRARCRSVSDVADPGGVLGRAGVHEGQPFVLGPDGSYDLELNRFFRELDGWGVRSKNGMEAYARDVMLFCRFLSESRGGKTIWQCDGADLRAYKVVRLRMSGPNQVTVGTWNRAIAALDKWVSWAIYEKLLVSEPFRYIDKTVLTPQGLKQIRANSEHESDPELQPPRIVSLEDYLLWRDVGLRGELPDGRPDRTWRGRHGERNAMFADVLVQTGMRLGEAASLLVCEIPPVHGAKVIGDVNLSPEVTKRGKGRTVFLPRRNLRALHHYIEIERDELIERTRRHYSQREEDLLVARTGRMALRLHGEAGTWSYAKIDVEARASGQRILKVGGQ